MYFTRFMEALTECEIEMNSAMLEYVSIHPYRIVSDTVNTLHEAQVLRGKAEAAFQKAVEVFNNLVKEIMKAAEELTKRNGKWIETVQKFNINDVNLKGFEHQMFDYKTGITRANQTDLPKFESVNIEDFSGAAETFKQAAFKDIYESQDSQGEGINPNYFKGGAEKITIKEHQVSEYFRFGVDFIKNYSQTIRRMNNESIELDSILKSVSSKNKVPVNESTVLIESIFRDEYYDILLEDAIDHKDLELEDKQEEEQKNNITDKDTVIETKTKNQTLEAVQKYWKICSQIQTLKMNAYKDAYCEFTKFIDLVMDRGGKRTESAVIK